MSGQNEWAEWVGSHPCGLSILPRRETTSMTWSTSCGSDRICPAEATRCQSDADGADGTHVNADEKTRRRARLQELQRLLDADVARDVADADDDAQAGAQVCEDQGR